MCDYKMSRRVATLKTSLGDTYGEGTSLKFNLRIFFSYFEGAVIDYLR